jgi:hypothetical protein
MEPGLSVVTVGLARDTVVLPHDAPVWKHH